MGLTLLQALRISSSDNEARKTTAAFAGAGGKTIALFQLAHQLFPPVVVTATTHLGNWQTTLGDRHVIVNSKDQLEELDFRGITIITGPVGEDGRTEPISQDVLDWLHARSAEGSFSLLIEADGSRQRPLKAPAPHEPAIPEFANIVVVAAGLSALSRPLDENTVHRPEIFSDLTGLKSNEEITNEAIVNMLVHHNGGLKNIPPSAKRIVLLNQADTPNAQASAQTMANQLLTDFDAIITASLTQSEIYAVHEPVAGIILAAGESKRFGRPKQLLDWREEPFLRAVAKTAIKAGLSPVIVVTGARHEEVEPAVQDLPVKIVRNEKWQRGQSSSIQAGLKALTSSSSENQEKHVSGVGAAVFLLSDQPQIPDAVVRALIAHHATQLYPIIAPLVLMEQRANPVLFDRTTFPDLFKLEGDVGGRAIFSKHPVEYLPWHDDSLLLDVDKPEDYSHMKELE